MAATATIQTRVNKETKAQAKYILSQLNITLSEAIAIYLRQIILHRGIPFEIKIPNKDTLQAVEELESGGGAKLSSVKDLFEELKR
jgi:DNA-damage-inducible protein J